MHDALNIEHLEKRYAGGQQALRGISLRVAQGDFFALLGPNGAGKSTAIGILATLVNKTAGRVSVFGHDLDAAPGRVKACLGLVPQEFNFNGFETVRHIVLNQAGYYGIPRRAAQARAETTLRRLDLWDRRDTIARQLSGGMKRRLMIARALMHEPRLLVLDEPTAGVDIEIRRAMWAFLRDINREGTTIILTTHYLEEAENLCRNVAIIDHGRIVENTSVKRLLASLHMETFVLDLAEPLDQAPDLSPFPARLRDPWTLEVEVLKAQSLNGLFERFAAQDIQVLSMRNKANRLEELFLRLVEQGRG